MGLREKTRPIGYIHCDVLRVAAVKSSISIRQLLAVALLDRHLILHLEQRAKSVACLDKRLREETGLPVMVAENPLTSVVLGAGKMLTDLALLRKVTTDP